MIYRINRYICTMFLILLLTACGNVLPGSEPEPALGEFEINVATSPCEIPAGGSVSMTVDSKDGSFLPSNATISWQAAQGAFSPETGTLTTYTPNSVDSDTEVLIQAALATDEGSIPLSTKCLVKGGHESADATPTNDDEEDSEKEVKPAAVAETADATPTQDSEEEVEPVATPETADATPTEDSEEGEEEVEPVATETPLTLDPTPTPVVGMGIDDILTSGRLIAGVPVNFPPFGYEDENGNRVGFDVDIVREFAKRWLGDENAIEFELVRGDARFVSLEQAQTHLTIAAMTATFERCERVGCSQTYFEDGARLLVHPDSGINSICDLEGQHVAVAAGTTGESNIQNEAPRWCDYTVPPAVKKYAEQEDGFDAVKTRTAAAYTTDGIALEGLALENPPLIVVGDPFSSEPYSIAVTKENQELLDLINFTLQEMKRDGTYDALSVRWFGCERIPFPIITDKGTPSEKIRELMVSDAPLVADSSCNAAPEAYVVQTGDTLIGLSARFYGSATLYQCIHDANWDTIGDDPRKMQPGMSLTIPDAAECSQ